MMEGNHFCIFVFLLWPTIVKGQLERVKNRELEICPIGILDEIINKTMELLRPNLANLHIKRQNFETGSQEFGNFNGNVSEVLVEGLEKFVVKVINTSWFDLNNLTIVEEEFTAKGFYWLNGTLAFPLGKNDIHLFGDGEFSAKLKNFSFSVKMKIRVNNGTNLVHDFDIAIGFDKIEVNFKNLMGGGDLEKVFNKLMNDVGLTVFNYYKEPVLNIVKPQIVQIITDMLNKKFINNEVELSDNFASNDIGSVNLEEIINIS